VSAFFGDPNALCGYLILTFWAGVYLVSLKTKAAVRLPIGIMMVVVLVAIVLTNSRSGWICFTFSATLFFFICALMLGRHGKRIALVVFAAIMLAVAASAMVSTTRKELDFGNRLASIPAFLLRGEARERLYLWRAAVEISKENPFFGTGPGTFYFEQVKAQKKLYDAGVIDGTYVRAFNTYNDYLQIMSEMGVIGLAAYMIFLAAMFFNAARFAVADEKNRFLYIVLICAGSSVALGHISFQFPFYNTALMSCFLLFSGIAMNRVSTDAETARCESGIARVARVSVIVAVCLSLAAYSFLPIPAAYYYQKGFVYYYTGDCEEAVTYLTKSVRLNHGNFLAHYYLGACYSRLKMYDDAAGALETSAVYFPSRAGIYRVMMKVDLARGDSVSYDKNRVLFEAYDIKHRQSAK
jgi:tetratricopeptide (TPR) repeat protein